MKDILDVTWLHSCMYVNIERMLTLNILSTTKWSWSKFAVQYKGSSKDYTLQVLPCASKNSQNKYQ